MIPVVSIYSSFYQRGFDQVIHDICTQNLHVVMCVDRAGCVGSDGETHQGLFDVVFLQSIPNITVFAPATYKELHVQFEKLCYETENVGVIRYPRGSEVGGPLPFKETAENFEMICGDPETLLISYGREIGEVIAATDGMETKPSILKINKIIPLSDSIIQIAAKFKNVLIFEDLHLCNLHL